ncbi:MAG TPA: S9 family peptidase [Candidatus Acidoferrales bacterium]|nr:S9 family peptidase [Candidatus Acidoferrales bacterium]
MKITIKILGLVVYGIGLFMDNAVEAATSKSDQDFIWTPESVLQVRQIEDVSVSPNGKQVLFVAGEVDTTNNEFKFRIYAANADGTGRIELTSPEKSPPEPQWSPDGSFIAFRSGRSGKDNLWLASPDGGTVRQLTEVETGINDFKWSPDGKSIAFTALDDQKPEGKSAKNNEPRVMDEGTKMTCLYVAGMDSDPEGKYRVRKLAGGNFSVSSFDWSPNHQNIVFEHESTPGPDAWRSAKISVVQVNSGVVRGFAHSGAAEYNPLWSPDGKWIAFIKTESPPTRLDRCRVCLISADGRKQRRLAETYDNFSFSADLAGWSADSRRIYFTEARGTIVQLGALPLNGPPQIIAQPTGVLSGMTLNASRSNFGFVFETCDQAPEAFVSDCNDFKPAQISWVNTNLPAVPPTEVIHWQSTGGLKIEGLLTYPSNYQKGKRYPLIVIAHGGPRALFLQNYIGSVSFMPIAAFAEHGYAILQPNIRGSSGYGNDFRAADRGDWGGGDFQDILSGVNYLVQQGIADNNRVGLAGWSYGGYMAAWAVTQTKRFRAVVAGGLACDLLSHRFTSAMPSWTSDYFGDVFKNRKAYLIHSPISYVEGTTTPTLILQGENDPLMPVSQAYEFYDALKEQGCPVKMVVYPRSGHYPSEPKSILDVMNRDLEWFDQYENPL